LDYATTIISEEEYFVAQSTKLNLKVLRLSFQIENNLPGQIPCIPKMFVLFPYLDIGNIPLLYLL
jgi:hypothetical protein